MKLLQIFFPVLLLFAFLIHLVTKKYLLRTVFGFRFHLVFFIFFILFALVSRHWLPLFFAGFSGLEAFLVAKSLGWTKQNRT